MEVKYDLGKQEKKKKNSFGTIIGMIIGSIIKFFIDIGLGIGKILWNYIDKKTDIIVKQKQNKNGRKKRK